MKRIDGIQLFENDSISALRNRLWKRALSHCPKKPGEHRT